MYEEKTKKGLGINWKSLIIKLIVLFVILFLIIWIISLVNKKKTVEKESNITTNLEIMKGAALEYFTGSKLPESVNGKKRITLDEMINSKLLVEFKDQDDKACNGSESYAEATKLNNSDYSIKVKLVCDKDTDYVINTIHGDNTDNDNTVTDDTTIDNTTTDVTDKTNTTTNNSSNTNKTNSNKTNTSTNKNNTTSNTSNKNNTTNSSKNNTTATGTCTNGTKDYNSNYTVAYFVKGNCAVSKDALYYTENSVAVSNVETTEYKKLYQEMTELKRTTGADLSMGDRVYTPVKNKSGKGYVGFQIKFEIKQKVGYTTKTIYSYYLDQNGNRKTIVDNRNSLKKTITSSTRIAISINRASLSLNVGDTYGLVATVTPNNYKVTWSSNNSSVASVDQNGKVTAKKAGTAIITAKTDGVSVTSTVTVSEEETYKYCSTSTERVYSVGYVGIPTLRNKTTYSYNYQVKLTSKNASNIYGVTGGNITDNSEYLNAYNYWKAHNLTFVDGTGAAGVDAGSYGALRDSALHNTNFKTTVRYAYRSGNDLYFNIYNDLYNLNNIRYATPFSVNSNYSVYFVPLYFDVVYVNKNDCEYITKNQITRYVNNGYVEV